MVAERIVIPVPPNSELARLLDEAVAGDVVLEIGRRCFRIVYEPAHESDCA